MVNIKIIDEFEKVKKRIHFTFYSILIISFILVVMGVITFVLGVMEAMGGKFETSILLTVLGGVDIIGILTYSMDRVQRNLGDQTQVEVAFTGLCDQRNIINKFESKTVQDIQTLNKEIERSTKFTMQLIQDFTEIAKPADEKPWLRKLPIKFGDLSIESGSKNQFDEAVVTEGKKVKISGSIRNLGETTVTLAKVVIAIRPPSGTPDGGPFMYDFYVNSEERELQANSDPISISNEKCIENFLKNGKTQQITEYGRGWYAFLACQTTDGCWHDDHNKLSFEVKKKETSEDKKTE